MSRRYDDTYFTEMQIRVLETYFSGAKVDEIAKKFGRSRADIYLILRRAKEIVRRCIRTLEVYAKVRGFIEVELSGGRTVLSAIETLIASADAHNIKLAESSAEILIKLIQAAQSCNAMEGLVLKSGLIARVGKDGVVAFRCGGDVTQ